MCTVTYVKELYRTIFNLHLKFELKGLSAKVCLNNKFIIELTSWQNSKYHKRLNNVGLEKICQHQVYDFNQN